MKEKVKEEDELNWQNKSDDQQNIQILGIVVQQD